MITKKAPASPVESVVRRRGQFQILIVDRTIVTIGRKWRSKWWVIKCAGCKSRRRKDGTCKHEREVFEMLKPEIKWMARIAV